MAQWVKVLAIKPDGLSLILRPKVVEGELTSDLHTCTVAYMHTSTSLLQTNEDLKLVMK